LLRCRCSKRDTHESVTDPDARMYRKGLKTGWKLQHMAHAVSENQHGLVVTSVSACSPRAERQAAIAQHPLQPGCGSKGKSNGSLLVSDQLSAMSGQLEQSRYFSRLRRVGLGRI
jgi:hypothetical protein